jgi:erythromycin esterase-like protein
MRRWLLAALALAAAPAAAAAQPRDAAMDAAVRDLCPRQIAMLGEASHGDGATFAFKAALIRRLVAECGYDAVLFEASHYDFVELMRRIRGREDTNPAMLSSAIGGIWNRYAELTPLIAFLFGEAQAGRLTLGGLDDQLGSAGAFYSNDQMPAELSALLPAPRGAECRETFRRRIYQGTPREPAALAAHSNALRACLRGMRTRAGGNALRLQLIRNIERQVNRDGTDDAALTRGRDESMFRNLGWYAARLGRRAKIIIWAHNVHIARDAAASTSFPQGGNLGAYVHRAFGRRAFALGFSAYGGAWRRLPFMQEARRIDDAPPDSLEARAMTGSDTAAVYRGTAWLTRLGRVPGRPYHYAFAPFDWARAFDGMIVFRAEREPAPAS